MQTTKLCKLHHGFAAVCRCAILPQHVASLAVSPTNDQQVWLHRFPMGRQLSANAIPLRASVEAWRWLNEPPIRHPVPARCLSPPKARPSNLFLTEAQHALMGTLGTGSSEVTLQTGGDALHRDRNPPAPWDYITALLGEHTECTEPFLLIGNNK